VDDDRIRKLTEEVLAAIRDRPAEAPPAPLEARLAALEAHVRGLRETPVTVVAAVVSSGHPHPSLRVLEVPGGGERCVLEPDKPCEKSGMCRTYGH
jgi:hypothetical protein